ncbi:metal tolerance protein C2-like [Primulina huaijiensis]|uniref:metal tolerance protein C2-like n=1 Tax=Primulina huaijiensis TaxID=1492673 RepID=UPI003CC73051
MASPSIPSSALIKCWRQVSSRNDIAEVSQTRFWELAPGHVVGFISLQMINEMIVQHPSMSMACTLGIQDLTVQIDCV